MSKINNNQRVLAYLQTRANAGLTLQQIGGELNMPTGSVASRIRDLRTFGYKITRKALGGGVHQYTLVTE